MILRLRLSISCLRLLFWSSVLLVQPQYRYVVLSLLYVTAFVYATLIERSTNYIVGPIKCTGVPRVQDRE